MASEQKWWRFFGSIAFWQFLSVVATMVGLTLLARYKVWPFGTPPADLGRNPSVFEILLNDRILMGFVRLGIIAVVSYVIVSIPALVIARRWMNRLTTAGFTADDAKEVVVPAQDADRTIEELQESLRSMREAYQDEVRQADLTSQLLLEQLQQMWDNPPDHGQKETGSDEDI